MKPYPTLTRLMGMLEALGRGPMSEGELAELLELDVRTARKMLRHLADLGYAVQGGGRYRRYRVTDRGRALGIRLATAPDIPASRQRW